MVTNYTDWNGYKRLDFTFEDRQAILVFPNNRGNGKWACKTEYFGAFPALESDLLARGFHLAYIKNKNRWGTDEDCKMRARFANFISDTYKLDKKFVPIGMSCGGLHAVNFASRYPGYVSVLYLDAPVMNLLSCPMGFGEGNALGSGDSGWRELVDAYGFTLSELLTYREHPIDRIPVLVKNKIPVAIVYGDSDTTVPYKENGKVLVEAYKKAELPLFVEGKEGCEHHPHGLENRKELLEFILRFA